jgi:hypothetical protein
VEELLSHASPKLGMKLEEPDEVVVNKEFNLFQTDKSFIQQV